MARNGLSRSGPAVCWLLVVLFRIRARLADKPTDRFLVLAGRTTARRRELRLLRERIVTKRPFTVRRLNRNSVGQRREERNHASTSDRFFHCCHTIYLSFVCFRSAFTVLTPRTDSVELR